MRIYKPKDRKGQNRKAWYITFYCNGVRRRMAISVNKKATENIATAIDGILACHGRLTPELQMFIVGMNPQLRNKLLTFGVIRKGHIPKTAKHADKPLIDHVKDFGDALRATATPKYTDDTEAAILDVFEQCGFETISDIDAHTAYKYLADKRKKDIIGQRTFNLHLGNMKQFCRWLIEENRTDTNPLAHLKNIQQTEKKRKRRALTLDEQRLLIEATVSGPEHSKMTGYERALLYRTALQTGLRAKELRSLTVSCFDFENRSITLTGAYTKNKKTAVLTMPPALAADIKAYIANKLSSTQVFKAPTRTAKMIERDHKAAGIEYRTDEGVADFHSLRHSFITNLARSGVHPSDAMVLARHSTITLTMNFYTHTKRESLQGIIDAQPDLIKKVTVECPKHAQ